MKSLRLHRSGRLELHEEPVPSTREGECLIRVTAVGICGSDLHWLEAGRIGDASLSRPLILGHEFAGVIEGGDRDGTRVAVDPAIPCDQCRECRQGHPNLCSHVLFAGYAETDGALRQWLNWSEKALFPLPDSISDEEGAMLEPLGVALHALRLSRVRVGSRVGIFGCGPIGLMLVQLVRCAGARVLVATDRLQHRLRAAAEQGAQNTVLAGSAREVERVGEVTGGYPLDVAFEVAGENAAVHTAVEAAGPGGEVLLVGIPPGDQTSFPASAARRKGLTLKLVRRMKHTYPEAIELVSSGAVHVRDLVTACYPLGRFEEAFRSAVSREGIKSVILPHGGK